MLVRVNILTHPSVRPSIYCHLLFAPVQGHRGEWSLCQRSSDKRQGCNMDRWTHTIHTHLAFTQQQQSEIKAFVVVLYIWTNHPIIMFFSPLFFFILLICFSRSCDYWMCLTCSPVYLNSASSLPLPNCVVAFQCKCSCVPCLPACCVSPLFVPFGFCLFPACLLN